MLTEDEAKAKICCGPMLVGQLTLVATRVVTVEDPNKFGLCIGSACMAWRRTGYASGSAPVQTGYCGLAGRPE